MPGADLLSGITARLPHAQEFSSWQAEYTRLIHELRDWALRMRRRDVLAIVSAAAGAAYAAPLWSTVDPDDLERIGAALGQPRRIDEATVTHIENALYHTRRQEDTLGPQAVMAAALAQHSLVRAVLKECPEGELHVRLLCLYANASRFIGWNLFNLNDFDGAGRYYELARSAAHEADNDVLSSLTLCNWSHLATWRGDPRLGVEHALGALAWASRSGSSLLSAYANEFGARAYAALVRRSRGTANSRERSACRAALDRARQHVSAAGTEDPAGPYLYFYGSALFASTEAGCLLDIGTPREATSAIAGALRSIDPQFTRNVAFCHLRLARALVREGELSQAGCELRSAAELGTRNMSLRLRQSITATHALVCVDNGQEFTEADEFLRAHGFEQ